jgi:hypothetical protein
MYRGRTCPSHAPVGVSGDSVIIAADNPSQPGEHKGKAGKKCPEIHRASDGVADFADGRDRPPWTRSTDVAGSAFGINRNASMSSTRPRSGITVIEIGTVWQHPI